MDPCYELVADRITPEDWSVFSKRLLFGFRQFPEQWNLDADLTERLLLRLQFYFFNPDRVEGLADKRNRAWGFMQSFLCAEFPRRFNFLRGRVEREKLDDWDRKFADFESLLYASSLPERMQLEWLSNFDARQRYGEAKRVKVIKKKGLGLTSELLGVNILMQWEEIKARYRFLMKKNHPDIGGDPAVTRQLIAEYERLCRESGRK
ncbi:MAG: J domain-containing protein [Acidobacteriota bacterium]|nr:J domain-containing protein [Acidobacteriota bacterium]